MLFKQKIIKFAVAIVICLTCHSIFAYELDAYNGNFGSGFGTGYMIKKKQLTLEEKEKQREAKEKLSAKKIVPNDQNFIHYTKKNNTEVIKLFLDYGMSPDTDYFGQCALYYAAKTNKTDVLKLLLDKGANPNVGFDSALFWAVKKKNPAAAKLLLDKGAKPNFTDLLTGKSILYTAVKTNQTEIAKELIEKGAKIDIATRLLIQKKNLEETLGINFGNN